MGLFRRRGAVEQPDVAALREGGDVDALIEALSDPADDVRRRAAMSLGEIGDPRAVEELARLLRDKGTVGRLRNVTVGALGRFGEMAVPHLAATLRDETEDVSVREGAAEELGAIGGPGALEALQGALDAGNPDVRIAAAKALERLGVKTLPEPDAETIEALTLQLVDIDSGDGFLSDFGATGYDDMGCHLGARLTGKELDAMGGYNLMLQVAEDVVARTRCSTSVMSSVWRDIGSWRA